MQIKVINNIEKKLAHEKISIYYIVHTVINMALLIAFRANIIVDFLSVVPVFLIVLMLIQAPMFKVDIHRNSLGDTAYSTGNTVRLTDDNRKNNQGEA